MPNIIPYALTFRGGLHIGTRGVNLEETGVSIPSDTLFSAIIDAWNRSGGDVDNFVNPFTGDNIDPAFLLSSAFPFAGGVRFYPVPVDMTRIFTNVVFQEHGKTIKSIAYFSEGLLRKTIAGDLLDKFMFPADELDNPEKGVALQGGSLWLLANEVDFLPEEFQKATRSPSRLRALRYQNVWTGTRVPRVTVDRISSSSTIYHTGRVVFAEDCGLWFGVQWRKPNTKVEGTDITYQIALEEVLHILQDDGLGGERSSGYGGFSFQVGDPMFHQDPKEKEPMYLLSRYHPNVNNAQDALDKDFTAYKLVSVGGWLSTPAGASQRRKRVFLVSEGSIISPPSIPPGDLVSVKPEYDEVAGEIPHEVYRYGIALGVGWKVGSNG